MLDVGAGAVVREGVWVRCGAKGGCVGYIHHAKGIRRRWTHTRIAMATGWHRGHDVVVQPCTNNMCGHVCCFVTLRRTL